MASRSVSTSRLESSNATPRVLLLANKRDGDLYMLECNAPAPNDARKRVLCEAQVQTNCCVRDAAAATEKSERATQQITVGLQVTKADLRRDFEQQAVNKRKSPDSCSPNEELLLAETLTLTGGKLGVEESLLSSDPAHAFQQNDPFKSQVFTPTALLSPSLSSPLTVASENNASELEEHIMQLTRELAVSKAENESLRRQLERCNAQLHEQKTNRVAEQNTLRQRHSLQLTELNKELAEARNGRADAEQARLNLVDELKIARGELDTLKQRYDAMAGATQTKSSQSNDKTVYNVSVASKIHPALSKPRFSEQATQSSRPSSPQNPVKITPEEKDRARDLAERCKTLEAEVSALAQQLARSKPSEKCDVETLVTLPLCDASTIYDACEPTTLVEEPQNEVETVHKSKNLKLKAGKADLRTTKSEAKADNSETNGLEREADHSAQSSENSQGNSDAAARLSDENEKLVEELKTLRSQDTEKEASITRLHKQLYNMKAAYKDLKESKDQMEQLLQSEQEANSAQINQHQWTEQKQELLEEIARLKEESERRAMDSSRSQSQLQSEKLALNIDAQETIIRLMIQLEEERAKLAATERHLQALMEENTELKASASQSEQVCRQLEARVQTLARLPDALSDLEAAMARKTAPITENEDVKQLKVGQFMKDLAQENAILTNQTFSRNNELMIQQTLVTALDADLQSLRVKNDALIRAYNQLRDFKDSQRSAIEKLEADLSRLAVNTNAGCSCSCTGQHVPPTHELLVALLKDRHRMQTEELETLHQRFALLEKDTALFLERMKHLNALNDEKIKLQVDTIVQQLDKLSSDRLELQTLVLDLKQQNEQLSAKLRQQLTNEPSAEHHSEVHPADEHLKTTASLPEAVERANILQLNASAEKQSSESESLEEPAKEDYSLASKLILREQASTSTEDLVTYRDADTAVDESIMQTLASSFLQPRKQTMKKELVNEAVSFLDTPPVTDRSDPKQPGNSHYLVDGGSKSQLGVNNKHTSTVAEDNEELDGGKYVSMVDKIVQVSEWQFEKRNTDLALQRVAQKEKEAEKSLAALFRVHETIKSDLKERTEKLHRLENELDMLTEALKLTLNEKMQLSVKLSDVRNELKRCRQMNLETKRKFNEESIRVNTELVNLNDRLNDEIENSNRTKQLLSAELEAKESRLLSKMQENENLKQLVEELEIERQKLTHKLEEVKSSLLNAPMSVETTHSAETFKKQPEKETSYENTGFFKSSFRESNRQSIRNRLMDDREAVRLLKESVEKLTRKARKEKKLHRISLNRIRSLESDNMELCKQLRSASSQQDSVRTSSSIDFSGKEKNQIVHQLVAQSEESARLFLVTINRNMENLRIDEAISTR